MKFYTNRSSIPYYSKKMQFPKKPTYAVVRTHRYVRLCLWLWYSSSNMLLCNTCSKHVTYRSNKDAILQIFRSNSYVNTSVGRCAAWVCQFFGMFLQFAEDDLHVKLLGIDRMEVLKTFCKDLFEGATKLGHSLHDHQMDDETML